MAYVDLYFRDEVEKKGAVIELAIIDYQEWIKTLLAISRNLDSYVPLAVYENGFDTITRQKFFAINFRWKEICRWVAWH